MIGYASLILSYLLILSSPWAVKRFLGGRLSPRVMALTFFGTILASGAATAAILSLALIKFLSSSLLTAMGDACGGIFEASHDFLAAGYWNYFLAVVAAAVFFFQLAFFLGGGAKLFRISSRIKKTRAGNSKACPALSSLASKPWARHTRVIKGDGIEAQTVGIFRPRIHLEAGLLNALTSDELSVVLAHEDAHRSGYDNLMLATAKVVSLTLFYLRGPRMAFHEMCRNLEIAADHKAAMIAGGRLQVASALARIVSLTRKVDVGSPVAASLKGSGPTDITTRLEVLMREEITPGRRLLPSLVLFTAISVAILMTFATSALAVTGTDQRDAFVCFTEHTQASPEGGICLLDHPDH